MRIHVFITAALLGLLSATHGVVAQDVAAMSDEDLFVLQRRLKDSGCYIGVLDRNRSPALEAAITLSGAATVPVIHSHAAA
jgi:hypothetical protein